MGLYLGTKLRAEAALASIASVEQANDAVQRNHEALWAYLAPWPGWKVHLEADAAWCESPVPHEFFNKVIRFDFTSPGASGKLQEIVCGALSRGVPLGFWLQSPSMEDSRRDILATLGFDLSAEGWSMVRQLDQPLPVLLPKKVEVVQVLEPALWRECAEIFGDGFALPQNVTEAYAQQMSASLSPASPLMHFAALEKGEVLACGTLFQGSSEVAGFYSLAVKPEARGRGLGRAVLAHALNQASQRGCHTAVLRATVNSFNLFASVGFSPVGKFQVLLTRPTSRCL